LTEGKIQGIKGDGIKGRWLIPPDALKKYIEERINIKSIRDAKSQTALTDRKRPSSVRSKHREAFNFQSGGDTK